MYGHDKQREQQRPSKTEIQAAVFVLPVSDPLCTHQKCILIKAGAVKRKTSPRGKVLTFSVLACALCSNGILDVVSCKQYRKTATKCQIHETDDLELGTASTGIRFYLKALYGTEDAAFIRHKWWNQVLVCWNPTSKCWQTVLFILYFVLSKVSTALKDF